MPLTFGTIALLEELEAKTVRRHCQAREKPIDGVAADVLELVIQPCEGVSGTEILVLPLACPNCDFVTLIAAGFIGLVDEAEARKPAGVWGGSLRG